MPDRKFSELRQTNCAVYYSPEGFDTSRGKLMGRHAAGEEFLKAWSYNSAANKLYCYAKEPRDFDHFSEKVVSVGATTKKREWISWQNWQRLSEPGCLFLPGPGLGPLAYQRRHLSDHAFSICGITHTTASDNVMDALGELLVAPTQRWDALICTSGAVKSMVETVIESYAEHLQMRFSLKAPPPLPVKLPVILEWILSCAPRIQLSFSRFASLSIFLKCTCFFLSMSVHTSATADDELLLLLVH